MFGVYHCFGLTFTKFLTIKDKPYERISWREFYYRNRRLKKKGEWFFDNWLIERAKACIHLFGYYCHEVVVLMPKKPLPLIVKIKPAHQTDKEFAIMVAPRIPNDEKYHEATGHWLD